MLGEQRLGGRLQGLGMKEEGFSSGKLIKSVRTALEISQEALVAVANSESFHAPPYSESVKLVCKLKRWFWFSYASGKYVPN